MSSRLNRLLASACVVASFVAAPLIAQVERTLISLTIRSAS